MVENLIYIIPGVTVGIIAGFIPGVGVFTSMMLMLPFLYSLEPYQLLTFYIALASTTQYIGSITATVFGLPGESSSLPAVKEGHALFQQGQGSIAISGSAIGSFLGSLLVLALVAFFIPTLSQIYQLYNTKIMALVMMLVVVLIVASQKQIGVAILMAVVGYYLSQVGCREADGVCFMTFNNPDLTTGLPLISVVAALYVVPQITRPTEWYKNKSIKLETNFELHALKKYFKHFGASLRGTVIGFVVGFLPGTGTVVSSNLSYSIEKWWQTKKGKYKLGNYQSLVSAETANNAAAFTVLLPLVVFGIPLIPSEALLYDIQMSNGFVMGENFTPKIFFENLALVLVVTNFIALIVAWPLAKYVVYIQKLPAKLFKILIWLVLIWALYTVGEKNFQEAYYLIVFFVLAPVGYLLRKFDTMPLIFTFIIGERLLYIFNTMKALYL